MDGINCSVHFLSLKQVGYEESNVAVTFYHDRTHFELSQRNQYAEYAEEFNLQQGRHFVLHNRIATTPSKMTKLKDDVKSLDGLFSSSDGVDNQNNTKDNQLKETLNNTANFNQPPKWNITKSNQLNNFFLSYLNSKLAKVIWLAPNRNLLIMQNLTLVWLVFDTVSGDLIKMHIDKTLLGPIGSNSSKLSGTIVSDAALLIRSGNLSSIFIITYSDKSIVDLITFNKNALLNEYLKSWTNIHKLEKLNTFEPNLTTYEFSCPTVYRIEKRISIQALSAYNSVNSTFTLWWPNDGQIVWNPKQTANSSVENQASSYGISLLERDDLRNNVLVLSTNTNDKNLMEYLFKSDGLLLSISYFNRNSLIAVEQTETNSQKYSINIYRYDLPTDLDQVNPTVDEQQQQHKKSLKIKLISFSLSSKIVSIEQVKVSKKFILMLSSNQTLILYDINRNIVHKLKLNSSDQTTSINENKSTTNAELNNFDFFNGIEWLLDDLLFCIYNVNGQIHLFDIGFNQISLNYMIRYLKRFKSISEYLNSNLFVPFDLSNSSSQLQIAANSNLRNSKIFNENNRFVCLVSSRNIYTESLWSCFYYSRGPFGLFRLALPENFDCISLITHYIKCSQIPTESPESASVMMSNTVNKTSEKFLFSEKYLTFSVNLLNQLDWNKEANKCLSCLFKILNFILSERVVFNLKTEILVEEALGSFYKPKRALLEKTIYENKHQVSRYARRFFYQLLKNYNLNKAFLLAVDIGAKDLFDDLFYCALDRNENQLAEACRKKYHEILSEENREKLKNELNRSITTIDDNIKGASTEFDKYSVSSSENNSIESDIDSNCSLNEMEQMDDLLDLSAALKIRDKKSKRGPPRAYTEQDIENYAKNIFYQNQMIHQLNYDNFS